MGCIISGGGRDFSDEYHSFPAPYSLWHCQFCLYLSPSPPMPLCLYILSQRGEVFSKQKLIEYPRGMHAPSTNDWLLTGCLLLLLSLMTPLLLDGRISHLGRGEERPTLAQLSTIDFALKRESMILGQWSNHVCVSRKSQASSSWAKQHRV